MKNVRSVICWEAATRRYLETFLAAECLPRGGQNAREKGKGRDRRKVKREETTVEKMRRTG